MCLDSIKEKVDVPSTAIISGWKNFNGSGKSLKFQNMAVNGDYNVPLDQWIVAEKKKIPSNNSGSYETGFHVYTEEKELKTSGAFTHVYIRKIRILGEQNSLTVAIADEMYVPSDPDAWPPKPGDPPKQAPPKKETLADRAKKAFTGKGGSA